MHYLYKFLGQDKEEIYIGETDNIDRRMREHRNRKDNLWNEKTEILFATVEDKTKAKQWERLLIEKHLPKYNVKDKFDAGVPFEVAEPDWKQFYSIYKKDDNYIVELLNEYLNLPEGHKRGHFLTKFDSNIKYAISDEEREMFIDLKKRFHQKLAMYKFMESTKSHTYSDVKYQCEKHGKELFDGFCRTKIDIDERNIMTLDLNQQDKTISFRGGNGTLVSGNLDKLDDFISALIEVRDKYALCI